MGDQKEILTVSRKRLFAICPRRHHYRYDLGIVPIAQSDAPRLGRAVHYALELWMKWQGIDPTTRLAMILEQLRTEFQKSDSPDPYEHQRVIRALIAYDARWRDQDWEVLAVEKQFTAPLVNPATGRQSRTFQLSGKMDAVIRVDGKVWIVEHKTTSADLAPGSDYWRKLRMDTQISTYLDGAASLGFDAYGVIYDVIGKPQVRPKLTTPEEHRKYTKGKPCKPCRGEGQVSRSTGLGSGWHPEECAVCRGSGWEEAPRLYKGQRLEDESPDSFGERLAEAYAGNPEGHLQRGEVVRLGDELSENRYAMWQAARGIREAARLDIHPQNDMACQLFNRRCEYFDLCVGDAQIGDVGRYRQERAHIELAPEPGKEAS